MSGTVKPDTISIIGGTGSLGFGLALRLGQSGLGVVIGSRDRLRAERAAALARCQVPDGSFEGLTNVMAMQRSEIAFLTVPFVSHAETVKNLPAT